MIQFWMLWRRKKHKKGEEIIREGYLKAKRKAKLVMYKSKKSAKDEKLPDIKQNDIFNMAKQIMKDSKLVLKKKKTTFWVQSKFPVRKVSRACSCYW